MLGNANESGGHDDLHALIGQFPDVRRASLSSFAMPNKRPQIKALLIDISGTLHVGAKQTKDAVGALRRLRASQIPFKLCSNSSKESTQHLIARLHKLGFEVNDSRNESREVWTSVGCVSRTLSQMGLKRCVKFFSRTCWRVLIPSASS